MPFEKLPGDYDQSRFQRILDRIFQTVSHGEKRVKDAVIDLGKEIDYKLSSLDKKLSKKIDDATSDIPSTPLLIPVPQNLAVYEFGLFGLAHVEPFLPWKYKGHVRGYEFYGSPNSGFAVHEDPYTHTGQHHEEMAGRLNDTYLYTADDSGLTPSFVLDHRLLGKTITNVTTSESGTIIAGHIFYPKYTLRAIKSGGSPPSYITWTPGNYYRISKYPSNRLFNIGSLSVFYKRLGNFYVVARTLGPGHAYSSFTAEQVSVGITSEATLDTPTIVYPVHNCGLTCTIEPEGSASWGKPRCPNPAHGIVPWSEIREGTREISHFLFFGVEWCNIELVWNAITTDPKGVWYDTRRGVTKTEDEEFIN